MYAYKWLPFYSNFSTQPLALKKNGFEKFFTKPGDCAKNWVFNPGFEPCPLSWQGQWCLQWFYDEHGCVVRTWINAKHKQWVAQSASDPLYVLAVGFLILFCDQRGKPLVDDCSCHSHAACGRKNEWWKWYMFDFSYSLIVSPFLLHLVPVIALIEPKRCCGRLARKD